MDFYHNIIPVPALFWYYSTVYCSTFPSIVEEGLILEKSFFLVFDKIRGKGFQRGHLTKIKTRWTFFRVKLVFEYDFEISWSLGPWDPWPSRPWDLWTLGLSIFLPLSSSTTTSSYSALPLRSLLRDQGLFKRPFGQNWSLFSLFL